jgi:hypothetical protein
LCSGSPGLSPVQPTEPAGPASHMYTSASGIVDPGGHIAAPSLDSISAASPVAPPPASAAFVTGPPHAAIRQTGKPSTSRIARVYIGMSATQLHWRLGSTISTPAGTGCEGDGAGTIAMPLNSVGFSGPPPPESGADRELTWQAATAPAMNVALSRRCTIDRSSRFHSDPAPCATRAAHH